MPDISEVIAEYLSLRPHYRELSATIAEWVAGPESAHLSDEAVAEMIEWNVATVRRARGTTPTKPVKVKPEPVLDLDLRSVLTNGWQTAESLVAALSDDMPKRAAYTALRKAHEAGLIEAKLAGKRLYGREVIVRTHYRLITE